MPKYLAWRTRLILLGLIGMVVAGAGAMALGSLAMRFGLLIEKASALAMTAAFFAIVIAGAWAYDRW